MARLAGFMLLAIADVARCRRWRAVLWLSLSVAMKPLALVPVLLVMAIDRPMTGSRVIHEDRRYSAEGPSVKHSQTFI